MEDSSRVLKERREEMIEDIGEAGLYQYENREELYAAQPGRIWLRYQPVFEEKYFYVINDNPFDLLINFRINVQGGQEQTSIIESFEDLIEKHLALDGFSVNMIFVQESGDDVFEVKSDWYEWPMSDNWTGDYRTLAHEALHLMGLPDEYDRIKAHATNGSLDRLTRLRLFVYQMDEVLPDDAEDGIMCHHEYKPLQRHACAAVGLGQECINERAEHYVD
jgi:hypothetical protein